MQNSEKEAGNNAIYASRQPMPTMWTRAEQKTHGRAMERCGRYSRHLHKKIWKRHTVLKKKIPKKEKIGWIPMRRHFNAITMIIMNPYGWKRLRQERHENYKNRMFAKSNIATAELEKEPWRRILGTKKVDQYIELLMDFNVSIMLDNECQ